MHQKTHSKDYERVHKDKECEKQGKQHLGGWEAEDKNPEDSLIVASTDEAR